MQYLGRRSGLDVEEDPYVAAQVLQAACDAVSKSRGYLFVYCLGGVLQRGLRWMEEFFSAMSKVVSAAANDFHLLSAIPCL